jgi:hypothetical protein
MADLDTTTTTDSAAPTAPAAEVSTADKQETPKTGLLSDVNSFIRGRFGIRPVEREASAPATEESTASDTQDSPSAAPQATETAPPVTPTDEKPFAVIGDKSFKTKSEYDEHLRRAAQSEADRRDARRAAETAKAEKRRLAKEDPYTLAKMVDKELDDGDVAEAESAKVSQIIHGLGGLYDQALFHPLVNAVPEAARADLAKDAPTDDVVAYRAHVAQAAVAAIKKFEFDRGLAEGEKKARSNPAVRKEILGETRARMTGPDLVEGTPTGTGALSANDWIRHMANRRSA